MFLPHNVQESLLDQMFGKLRPPIKDPLNNTGINVIPSDQKDLTPPVPYVPQPYVPTHTDSWWDSIWHEAKPPTVDMGTIMGAQPYKPGSDFLTGQVIHIPNTTDGVPRQEPSRPPGALMPTIPISSDDLGWNLPRIIHTILRYTKMAFKFVIQSYVDFFNDIRNFDGSIENLLKNTKILYDGVIVGFLTLGIVNLAPVFEIVGEIGWFLLNLLTRGIRFTVSQLETVMQWIEEFMWGLVNTARRLV